METGRLNNKTIAIIGMGHMGNALLKGLLSSTFPKEHILTSNTAAENKIVAKKADWILICVKPLIAKEVIEDLGDLLTNKIIISAVATLSIRSIETSLKITNQKAIRIMPNIPVSYKQGVIGIYANASVSKIEKAEVIRVLSLLGTVIECKKEDDLDVITIIAGCGPAVVSYFINSLISSGIALGLQEDVSEKVALQTFLGTLNYLVVTKQSPVALQTAVATKGGLTESIIKKFETKKIASQLIASLEEGYAKIGRLKEKI